jgi:hypothetical protein
MLTLTKRQVQARHTDASACSRHPWLLLADQQPSLRVVLLEQMAPVTQLHATGTVLLWLSA